MPVQTLIGTRPHALGGDSHSSSTLAQLNTKVSDATLDDSSDPRDPNDHASNHQHSGADEIATATPGANAIPKADGSGSLDSWVTHTPLASTAPVNVTKAAAAVGSSSNAARQDHKHDITTAAPSTAIGTDTTNAEGTATSLARSDHSHEVDVDYTQVTSVANFTTSSVTDVLITGMTITPGAGTYLVLFSAKAIGDGGAKNGIVSIYSNGTQVAHTERVVNDVKIQTVSTQAVVTVAAAQAIDARGRGDDTLNVDERSLIAVRLA